MDVIRTPGGVVEIVDGAEFFKNQTRYRYPADLVAATREATDRVVELLASGAEPCGNA